MKDGFAYFVKSRHQFTEVVISVSLKCGYIVRVVNKERFTTQLNFLELYKYIIKQLMNDPQDGLQQLQLLYSFAVKLTDNLTLVLYP